MFELRRFGGLAEAGSYEVGGGFAAEALRGFAGDGGIEAIEDEEVALGVIEGGEGGYSLEMVEGREGVHLVVIDLVPGDVPAGTVGLDADRELHGAEVVADGGQAGHEGELGAADREDERVVGGVGGDDLTDLRGRGGEGVVGGTDVLEGLAGVGYDKCGEGGCDGGGGEAAQGGSGCGVAGCGCAPQAGEDYRDKQGEGDCDDQVVPGLEIVVVGEESGVARGPEEKRGDERVAQEIGTKRKTETMARRARG